MEDRTTILVAQKTPKNRCLLHFLFVHNNQNGVYSSSRQDGTHHAIWEYFKGRQEGANLKRQDFTPFSTIFHLLNTILLGGATPCRGDIPVDENQVRPASLHGRTTRHAKHGAATLGCAGSRNRRRYHLQKKQTLKKGTRQLNPRWQSANIS